MLKSSPIFETNDAHFVEKNDVWKKQNLSTFEVLSALNMQKHFLFVSKF
jgi:hypothetical protein